MIEASSLGLADSLTPEERTHDLLYPRIQRIREISALIILKVVRAAQTAVSYSQAAVLLRKHYLNIFTGC